MPSDDYVSPASLRAITTHMMDVVVICRGINDHENFEPLCTESQKALLPILGVPLIVHCLAPWIESGCNTFHICHDDGDTTIMEALEKHFGRNCGIDFISVGVPFTDEEEEWGTCDALVEVLNQREKISGKNASISAPACGAGDTLSVAVIDCQTILTHIPLHDYLMHFYTSYASVSALLWEPPVFNKKDLEKSKKKPCDIPRVFTVLENEKSQGIGVPLPNIASPSMGSTEAEKNSNISFRRLHVLAREELEYIDTDNAGKAWRLGYLASRPNLELNFNLSDACCYLMSAWVLRYIRTLLKEAADAGGEGCEDVIDVCRLSFTDDVLSILAKFQHWSINKNVKHEASFFNIQSPADLIEFHCKDGGIKPHWALSTNGDGVSVADLNSRGQGAPPQHDILRVMACIVSQPKGIIPSSRPTRQYIQIRDKETYLSACMDLLTVFRPGGDEHINHHILHPKMLQRLIDWNTECVKITQLCGVFTQSKVQVTTVISNSIIGEGVLFDFIDLGPTKGESDDNDDARQVEKEESNKVTVSIGDKTFITGSIIMDGAKIGSGCRIVDSVVESFCVVPSGTKLKGTFIGRNQGK